ncbi:unnamed protein product [Diabrotica balteata]|uniref:Myosuppressin n=1 Tax=Diabrotica balteata TaxID=107213 RepID=A0A9N9SN12_DIABA|nr:unnamed protein product [Diabrotica balteata]
MQPSTIVVFFFATVLGVLSVTRASIISCPPNPIQEQLNPAVRQLCVAIEQAVEEVPKEYAERLDDRAINLNTKRQDVDHVFLRFGKRFGL